MNQKLSATIEFELVRTETLNEFKQSADFRGLGIERAYTNLFGPQFSPPTELTSSTMNNNQLNHPVQQPVNLKKNINSTDLPSMKPPNPHTAKEHCTTCMHDIKPGETKRDYNKTKYQSTVCQNAPG